MESAFAISRDVVVAAFFSRRGGRLATLAGEHFVTFRLVNIKFNIQKIVCVCAATRNQSEMRKLQRAQERDS